MIWTITEDKYVSNVRWEMAGSFCTYNVPGLILLLLSAASLMDIPNVQFAYDHEEFESIRFHRTWGNILRKGSSGFATQLQHALILAKTGHPTTLKNLLVE